MAFNIVRIGFPSLSVCNSRVERGTQQKRSSLGKLRYCFVFSVLAFKLKWKCFHKERKKKITLKARHDVQMFFFFFLEMFHSILFFQFENILLIPLAWIQTEYGSQVCRQNSTLFQHSQVPFRSQRNYLLDFILMI